MKRQHLLSLLVIGFGWTSAVQPADPAALNIERIREVALNSSSLLLDAPDKVRVAGTFVKLVQIKGISGQEELIREEVKHVKSMISSIMSI